MSQTQPRGEPPLNRSRLRSLFYKTINGEQDIPNSRGSKLFIEALCDQPDPVQCIQLLISSPKGLSVLQSALRSDLTPDFLNSSVTDLLKYIQAHELSVIAQGAFLRDLILKLTDPPIFWDAFVRAKRSAELTLQAQKGFAWLLLQLVSLPAEKASPFYVIGNDVSIQKDLLESVEMTVRVYGQKIIHIMDTIKNPNQFGDGPGPGGRHDNDFLDIRKIAILPTSDELESKESPYLRRATEIDECPKQRRLAMHIDNQFRLLREDMLRDLREELHVVFGLKQGRRKGICVDGLIVKGIDCDGRQQWTLRLECIRDLPQLFHVRRDQRRIFVEEHRNLLKHQSLACLITDGRLSALVTLHRSDEQLAQLPPLISVRFSGREECVVKSLLDLASARRIVLIQLNTAAFSYEPVLRQLQSTKQLLLQDEIMLWDREKELRKSPLSNQDDMTKFVDNVRAHPSCELKEMLGLAKKTKLDVSQARCLLSGLTQRLSLVQGPPGTGKSFIGALIAKAIYKFSQEKILVVCYTNHALDQFLEDLLDVGIPSFDIARLGSFVKSSSRTKDLVLSEQHRNIKTSRQISSIVGQRKDMIRLEACRLQEAFVDYRSSRPSKADILEYLRFRPDLPGYYEALLCPQEKNGMTRVSKKGKAMDQYYLLDRWVSGLNSGFHNQVEENFPDVWKMILPERMAALRSWESDIIKERVSKVYDCGKQYNEILSQIEELYSEKDRNILGTKRIIGCTTTAAAKYVQTIHSCSPGVVLVEEAGEILESHILTAIGRETGQLVMIGDHKQLRPKAHFDLSVENEDGYDLNRSLFERLILKGYPHEALSQQHRMRPEISALVRQLTYPDLTNAPSTKRRPNLRGFQDNLMFVNHESLEQELGDTPDLRDAISTSSKRNAFEANMTLRCVRYLGQQGYRTDQIVILTPYIAQLRLLFDVLAQDNDPTLNDLDSHDLVRAGLMPAATANTQKRKLQISTIDNYQGEESDIVVVSLTRSNDRGDIGFLSSPERVNVLLSRARDALIIIGNSSTFLQSLKGRPVWGRFFDIIRKGRHVYDGFPVKCERHPDRKSILRCPQDFDQCPDGGCSEPCGELLRCGVHKCPNRCHQLSDHSKMPCRYKINDKCSNGHVQVWQCRMGRPPPCRQCEIQRKAMDKKVQDDLDRQQKEARQREEHAAKMAKVDEEIRSAREKAMEERRSTEMLKALKQKEKDLENAKHLTAKSWAAKTPESAKQRAAATSKKPEMEVNSDQPAAVRLSDFIRLSRVAPSPSEAEWGRQKRVDNASNDAIDSLMKMTGLEDVKAQFLRIKARIDLALRQNTDMNEERFGMVLLGNPGTGKTTVARLYAKFLTSVDALTGSELFETSGSRLANEGVSGAKKHVEYVTNAGGGAFFIDEAYQLASSPGGAAVLDFLLAEIENQVGKIVFVLAGYTKPMEAFFEHNQGFHSRIPYRLQFADYNDAELLQIFGQRVDNKYDGKMKIEEGVTGLYARIAIRRLGRGRGREAFGNARALENFLAKVLERQAHRVQRERAAGSQPDDFMLTQDDLIGPEPSRVVTDSAAWKELQGLIGLKAVKDSMQALLDRVHTNYQRELQEKEVIEVSLNRVFLGPPGTGKTSVAKLYGQVLTDLGLLSNGEVIAKNPADFVGSALGESERNTKAILKAAEGKVLIIDEAYMLYSGTPEQGNSSDPYRTAVVDTLVSEVQSTLGEDRCVLLLGYKEKLEEMFQNMNPGLARRFPLDDAFVFEDFDDDQLRKILELKLKKQCLDATKEAADVAISVLARARLRTNFGNAGEVENMISHAKAAHQIRNSTKPLSARSSDIIFEPEDFDVNFNRSANAVINCRELFRDVIGSDAIVAKLESYVQTAAAVTARGLDPRDYVPFNFIFKGPPGTGKTMTARKMGQVFYDMGFLSTPEVHECSSTDLVAPFVGQTGPKTIKLLEKALGKVLFIDEAYRLGEGVYATEAISELVDSLTKPRFAGKIIVILAGYEENMNELLRVNKGLSSRFSEEVFFANMGPEDCWNFLQRSLTKTGIVLGEEETGILLSEIISLFGELSSLASWGNGRDLQTISKSIMAKSLIRHANSRSLDEPIVSLQEIKAYLSQFLAERRARSGVSPAQNFPLPPLPGPLTQAMQHLVRRPLAALRTNQSIKPNIFKQLQIEASKPTEVQCREESVTNETWAQLQEDKAAEVRAQHQRTEALNTAAELARAKAHEEAAAEREFQCLVLPSTTKEDDDDDAENQEFQRRVEQMRTKALALSGAKDAAEKRWQRLREEDRARCKEINKVQEKLRRIGNCEMGYPWIKQSGGWRCGGGTHFVSDGEFEAGMMLD